jgi:hypothetical protein
LGGNPTEGERRKTSPIARKSAKYSKAVVAGQDDIFKKNFSGGGFFSRRFCARSPAGRSRDSGSGCKDVAS